MNNIDPESMGSPPIDPPPTHTPITQQIAPHKEEFEFKSTSSTHDSLKILKKLSILTAFLSLYQLTYGSLSIYNSSTSTASISTLMGLISLSLSVLLAIWSTRVSNAENGKTLLSEDIIHGTWENMNRTLFLSLTFRAMCSFVLIPNIYRQREYTGQYENLAILASLFEALICITFLYGARTSFKYLKQPGQTMSRLVFMSNLVLMGSSLSLLSSVSHAEGYINYEEVANLYPSWNLTGLFAIGLNLTVMSLLVWLVNFKQWRVPYITVTGVMTILVIGLTIFSGYSYVNCGSLLGGLYEKPFLEVSNWSLVSLMSSLLILVGGLYFSRNSGRDMEPESQKKGYRWLGMLGAVVLVSFVASTMHSRSYIKEKGSIVSLEDLETVEPIKTFKEPTATPPSISLFLEDELLDAEDIQIMMENEDMLLMVATSMQHAPRLPDKDVKEIVDLIVFRKHKYVILGFNETTNNAILERIGEWSNSYEDFVKNFKPGVPKVALIHMNVENVPKLVVIVFENAEMTVRRKELQAANKLPTLHDMEKMGVYVHFANKLEDLKVENVVKSITPQAISHREAKDFITSSEIKIIHPLASQPDNIPTYELTKGGHLERIHQVFVSDMGAPLGTELFKMIAGQSHKYIIQRYNSELNQIELANSGGFNTTYDDFYHQINPHEAQVGLIYLCLEDVKKLALIIYAPEDIYPDPTTVYKMFNLPTDPYNLRQLGARVTVIRNMEELKAEHILKNMYGDHIRLLSLTANAAPFLPKSVAPLLPGTSSSSNSIKRTISSGGQSKPSVSVTVKTPVSSTGSSNSDIFGTVGVAERAVAPPPGMFLAELGSLDGLDIWRLIQSKEHKYVILRFKKGTTTPHIFKIGTADAAYRNFLHDMDSDVEQIGLINLKLETVEKTALIAYSPKGHKKAALEVLKDFGLPNNVETYKNLGISLVEAHESDDILVKPILRRIYTDKAILLDIIEENGLQELLGLDNEDYLVNFCEACKVSRDNEFLLSAFEEDGFTEATERLGDADISFIGKMGLDLRRDIVKPIQSKRLKYVILKKDPSSKKGEVYIANSGTWHATFEQFAKEFEPNEPQVGFIYLEIEKIDKLVMVVYAPDNDESQVFKDFGVAKSAQKLEGKGISIYAAHSKDDLVLDKVMDAAYGPRAHNIHKLIALVEAYTEGPDYELMFGMSQDEIIEAHLGTELFMLDRMGLSIPKDNIRLIAKKDYKYVIFRYDPATKKLETTSQGSWHASFDQFVRDFDPLDDQIGFIHLELEHKSKLVMVLYSPKSARKSNKEIFDAFKVSKNPDKLENNGVSTYIARNMAELDLEKVLDQVFDRNRPTATSSTLLNAFDTSNTPDARHLALPADIADAINNKKYKYIIIRHDPKTDNNFIESTGKWGSTYENFVKDFSGKRGQLAFIYLNIETKDKLALIVFAPKVPPSQVLRDFRLPENITVLEDAGFDVYVARDKKDLELFKVLEGIHTDSSVSTSISYLEDLDDMDWDFSSLLEANDDPLILAEAYNATDFQLDKDILDALNNKKYKYMIFKHDSVKDHTYLDSYGKWGSTYKDFVGDFAKRQAQVGLIYLEVEAKEYLVVIAYAPKSTGTQLLREFGFPDDLEALKRYGIKAYIAHSKKDMELPKVLEGIYHEDTFVQNNPAFLGLVQLDDVELF